jgi:6-phosphofructokinase 1
MNANLMDDASFAVEALTSSDRVDLGTGRPFQQMARAGPRATTHFDPDEGCAVIVSVGGLCPGANVVIRKFCNMLRNYGAPKIYGVRGGFSGIPDDSSWVRLTPEMVQDIHSQGGTFLKSERGPTDHVAVANALKAKNARQLLDRGGDGAHNGILQIFTAVVELEHEYACCGVPGTIDVDIPLVDTSLDLDTACTAAKE